LLKSLDDSIKNLTEALEILGLTDNTIILLTSDNGGFSAQYKEGKGAATSNYPFKQGKKYLGDGGIRVPLLIKAPGQVTPGKRSSYQSHGTDIFPTLLDLAGLPLLPNVHVDGRSLVPAISGVWLIISHRRKLDVVGRQYRFR